MAVTLLCLILAVIEVCCEDGIVIRFDKTNAVRAFRDFSTNKLSCLRNVGNYIRISLTGTHHFKSRLIFIIKTL